MVRLLVLAVVVASMGCSDGGTPPSGTGKVADLSDSPLSASPDMPTLEYPEKPAVVRLLTRASTLELEGKFKDALSVANQAVAIDPTSPKATALKARLEELLRRA